MFTPGSLRYLRDAWSGIVYGLATSEGPVYVRLEREFRTIKQFRAEDFPDDLRENFEEILNTLVVEETRREEGKLPATLEDMSEETAQNIAKNIVRLYQEIEKKYLTE